MNLKHKKVLATGVFDILHKEHKNFLKKAKKLGNFLIIGIESDKRVRELKGRGRPVNKQETRIKNLKKLEIAENVFVLPEGMGEKSVRERIIKKIRPDFLAVSNHTPFLNEKREIIEKYGGELVVVHEENPEFSTSKLVGKVSPQC
ncbi:MAG: adenylyltransferase/cytidyltransferase family protein [Patescibacteria group bacterium]